MSEQAQEKYNTGIKSFIEDFERYATAKDQSYIQYLENFSAKRFNTLSKASFNDFIQTFNYRLHCTWITFKFTNTNNEETRFSIYAIYTDAYSPYLLPVMMEINDGKDKILIYSVELSQYIRKCIPQATDKFFDDGYFLYHLAHYLYYANQ